MSAGAYAFEPADHAAELHAIIDAVEGAPQFGERDLHELLRRHPRGGSGFFSKSELIRGYRELRPGDPGEQAFVERVRMKPVRTRSGVAPVTVLTRPFPCPGRCIFCPSDVRMPKSYLSSEPGAQRAAEHQFDPFRQTFARLRSYRHTGHATDKVELIVLGGTWSSYPDAYQVWFVLRCFEAMNQFAAWVRRAERGRREARDPLAGFAPDVDFRQLGETVDGSLLARRDERSGSPGSRTGDRHRCVEGASRDLGWKSAAEGPHRNLDDLRRASADQSPAGDEGRRSIGQARSYNQVVRAWTAAHPRAADEANRQAASWDDLGRAQRLNETASVRCVGLSLETRPDRLDRGEALRMRRLGATKVQIGVQSMDDEVLALNKRGHDVETTRRAVRLLRETGFKIQAHWMPNLHGSTPAKDREDFDRLFRDPALRPDELKIYPCSLVESAELMAYHRRGAWRPYDRDELLDLLVHGLGATPRYCRLTRIIRDIPGTDIVTGNRTTNMRQVAEAEAQGRGVACRDIRAREIGGLAVDPARLRLRRSDYEAAPGREVFLEFVDAGDRIAGFLRLHLPGPEAAGANGANASEAGKASQASANRSAREDGWSGKDGSGASGEHPLAELAGRAVIREVHVYGAVVALGDRERGRSQHAGLGRRLIAEALEIAAEAGFDHAAVISSVGTREYYRRLGFTDGALYQHRPTRPGLASRDHRAAVLSGAALPESVRAFPRPPSPSPPVSRRPEPRSAAPPVTPADPP